MSTSMSTSLVGRTVDGRYTVRRHVADGGMGSVYLAIDERLDREVALKVMRADLARDAAFVSRFHREAKAAARLTHPNVVAVTDQGEDGPCVFIAMEMVHGCTLRQIIRSDAPLPTGRALDIAEAILQALAAAHQAGLVHRDVKPENVLIRDDGAVKVADFGLARAVTTETLTTDSDVLLGTAAYLSPEQVEHGRADERTDVYAAALLLFEMLTGRKAFPGDSPIHVAYQHVHGDLPVPSDLVPTIPVDLDGLVALGAAKDPEHRPPNARAYLDALRSVRRELSEEELQRPPRPTPDDADVTEEHLRHTRDLSAASVDPVDGRPEVPGPQRHRGRRRLWAALGTVLVLALVAAWALTFGPFSRTTVPALRGTAQGAAVAAVRHADLRAEVERDYSETVARGTVISASPKSGAHLRKRQSVVLHISKGPQRYDVPRLAGTTVKGATSALHQQHLALGTVTKDYSATVPSGQVISIQPAAGSPVKKGTTVDLTVSQGRQPVDIPDVRGQTKSDARAALTDLGLRVTLGDDAYSSTVDKGDVISQTPQHGAGHKGDSVTLVVSKGPPMVTVPNVHDKTVAEATAALQAAGLEVKVVRYFGGIFDNVRGQDPGSGQRVPIGTTVTISVV